MASISYQYNTFEFNRRPLAPIKEEEFDPIKKDFEKFLGDFLDEKESEFQKLKNPHAFNLKIFLCLLVMALVFGFTGNYLEKHNHENFGLAFDLVAVLAGFSIVLQPLQWLSSDQKSSHFHTYEKRAREYYFWHRRMVVASDNYADYRTMLSKQTEEDFISFCRDEL